MRLLSWSSSTETKRVQVWCPTCPTCPFPAEGIIDTSKVYARYSYGNARDSRYGPTGWKPPA
jgi:hypothetical protein